MVARIVDKNAKRIQILDAAIDVFARKGINDFKIIEIAETAGVGKGTIYEYFPSKDDIIVGCFTYFTTKYNGYMQAQLADIADPVEMLKRLVAATFEFCFAERKLFNTIFDFYAAGIPRHDGKSLLTELSPMYKGLIAWIKSIVDIGISQGQIKATDSQAAASAIMATLDGIFFQIALGVTDVPSPAYSDKISDFILNGLLNHEKENS